MRARKNSAVTTSTKKNNIRLRGSTEDKPADKLDVVAAVPILPLMAWAELEEWQRDNLYIYSGYRPISHSYLKSWKSWFYLHNESVSIYTHLFAALAVFPTWYYVENVVLTRYSTTTNVDSAVLAINFVAAATCLSASTTYHTLLNHSHDVGCRWLLIDFLGILAMIIGSFYPGVYYGFYCERTAMLSYWTMVSSWNGLSSVKILIMIRLLPLVAEALSYSRFPSSASQSGGHCVRSSLLELRFRGFYPSLTVSRFMVRSKPCTTWG